MQLPAQTPYLCPSSGDMSPAVSRRPRQIATRSSSASPTASLRFLRNDYGRATTTRNVTSAIASSCASSAANSVRNSVAGSAVATGTTRAAADRTAGGLPPSVIRSYCRNDTASWTSPVRTAATRQRQSSCLTADNVGLLSIRSPFRLSSRIPPRRRRLLQRPHLPQ
ncbi:hypothetical protein K523DRAFT_127677 [Schizophyllum commune Tattone D]|nr:hypothetical protein K523DRAFT_127677 [Schizophyllum commune Tattone D]